MEHARRYAGKKIAAMALAMVFACVLVILGGCQSSSAPSSQTEQQPSQAEMVKDMNGDDAIEAGSAKTLLTVNSVATQMVLMCGGEDAAATLGQGFQYGEGSLNQKMFPNLGGLRTFTRDDATVENVAAINPDLVLIDVPDTVSALRDANIHAAYMSVVSPDTLKQAVTLIGDALGGGAATKAAQYNTYYDGVAQNIGDKSKALADADKPRVLYMRDATRVIGASSIPDHWITTAGGINVGAELNARGGAGSEVTTEAILGANPDIIVCERPELAQTLATDAQYATLKAVQNGKVFVAPLGTAVWSMGTAEAPLMLYWASTVINPELYVDIDVAAQTKDFFNEFYGYQLSDSEVNSILTR